MGDHLKDLMSKAVAIKSNLMLEKRKLFEKCPLFI
jgi:hypothetical protein